MEIVPVDESLKKIETRENGYRGGSAPKTALGLRDPFSTRLFEWT